MAFWLFKSEPDTFGIHDLEQRGSSGEIWDGVRNYQARNMLRDQVAPGDTVLFYHSNCDVPGIAGIARVVENHVVDPMQFNPDSKYFDPGSRPDAPRWITVKIIFERHTRRTISLTEIKGHPELQDMQLVKRGNRLSILPVTDAQANILLTME